MKSKKMTQNFINRFPDICKPEADLMESSKLINSGVAIMMVQIQYDYDIMVSQRRPKKKEQMLPIFRELDKKWNSIRKRLFEHYGKHIIMRDGFTIIYRV